MSIVSKLGQGAAKLLLDLRMPYQKLSEHPLGKQIWQLVDNADRAKLAYQHKNINMLEKAVKIKANSVESEILGKLLDSDVGASQLAQFPSEVQKGYSYVKSAFERHADEAGLAPGKRFKDYLPHMFDKDTLVKSLTEELAVETDLAKALKIANVLDDVNKNIKTIYENIPQELKFAYFEKRKGRVGYEMDAVKAYKSYVIGLSRKLYDEPAAQKATELLPQLPKDIQPYAKWYIRDYLGLEQRSGEAIAQHIKNFEFVRTIGFNPRSIISNFTQHINTISDIGPVATIQGVKLLTSPEGKQLLEDSGHTASLGLFHTLNTSGKVAQGWKSLLDIAGYFFNKVEYTDRGVAYLGALAKHGNKTSTELIKQIQAGALSQDAFDFADDVIRRTQFRYGKVNLPRALRNPALSVVGQYSAYGLNSLAMMNEWAKKSPKKLLGYLALSQGITTSADKLLNIDLSGILGSGVDFYSAFGALYNSTQGEWDLAGAKLQKVFASGTGNLPTMFMGGKLGPGFEAVKSIGSIVNLGKEAAIGNETFGTIAPKVGKLAQQTFDHVTRVKYLKAKKNYEAGGSVKEFIKQTIGFPSRESEIRLHVLQLYELGQRKRAGEVRAEFQKQWGKALPMDSAAVNKAWGKWLKRKAILKSADRNKFRYLPDNILYRLEK